MKLSYMLAFTMTDESYKKTLQAARDELADLLRRREEINRKIGKLAPVVEYLAALCDEPTRIDELLTLATHETAEDLGLSDAIRLVLKSAGVPLTPTQIRDRLGEIGYDLDRYASVMPPIHNTLDRLKAAGELELDVSAAAGKKTYRLRSGLRRALLEPPSSLANRRAFGGPPLSAESPKRGKG